MTSEGRTLESIVSVGSLNAATADAKRPQRAAEQTGPGASLDFIRAEGLERTRSGRGGLATDTGPARMSETPEGFSKLRPRDNLRADPLCMVRAECVRWKVTVGVSFCSVGTIRISRAIVRSRRGTFILLVFCSMGCDCPGDVSNGLMLFS